MQRTYWDLVGSSKWTAHHLRYDDDIYDYEYLAVPFFFFFGIQLLSERQTLAFGTESALGWGHVPEIPRHPLRVRIYSCWAAKQSIDLTLAVLSYKLVTLFVTDFAALNEIEL